MLETETMGTEAVGELVVGTVAGKDECRRRLYHTKLNDSSK